MMLSLNGARQISGNSVTMSIFILRSNVERPMPNVQRRIEIGAPRAPRQNLFYNFQDCSLTVARGRTGEQCANSLDGLAAPANHTTNISSSKLQLKNGRPAVWNFCQHHIVRKLNQLPNDELKKFPHGAGN